MPNGDASKRRARGMASGKHRKPGATAAPIKQEDERPETNQTGWASKPEPLAPGLYLVATPIGNAADLTLRAADVLSRAEIVACEDTRVTRRLLALHGLQARLTAYHDHNAPTALPRLMKRLQKGEIVALVSDAGTPLVSDPGYRLVQAAISEGIAITTAPGPVGVTASPSYALGPLETT